MAGLAVALRALGAGTYEGARVAREMGLLRPPAEPALVLRELPASRCRPPAGRAVPARGGAGPRPAPRGLRGRARRPTAHFNARGELVGFDVEMAHALAGELGVALELAPVPRERLAEALEAGRVDVVMGGVFVTTRRAGQLDFSPPYLDETLAFVVPDHRRAEFSSAEWVRAQKGLRVGVPDLPYFLRVLRREFPNLEVVPRADAATRGLLHRHGASRWTRSCLTAERGSFLTLLHPAFSVAVPHPLEIRLPLAYPVARHDLEMARFLGDWIDLKKKDGTIQALYDHWILGRDARPAAPRAERAERRLLGWLLRALQRHHPADEHRRIELPEQTLHHRQCRAERTASAA